MRGSRGTDAGRSAEDGSDLGEDLIDGDGGEAFFLLNDAGFQLASGAVHVVIKDAMLLAVGEPDAGDVASGEDGHAGGFDGSGEVHGAAVVADEDTRPGEDGGTLAGCELATEIDDGAAGILPPTGSGEVAGLTLFGSSAEGKGVPWVEPGKTAEEGAPVLAAPILGLDLGADAEGDEGEISGGGENLFGAEMLCRGEMEVPVGGTVEIGWAELDEVAGEPAALKFKLLPGSGREIALHVDGEGDTDLMGDAAEAEEEGVAFSGIDSAGTSHVNEHLRTPAEDFPPKGDQLSRAAGADGIAEEAMDEAGVLEDGSGGRSFDIDGKVGEEAALGIGKGACREMDSGQGDDCISKATEAIEKNPLDDFGHVFV